MRKLLKVDEKISTLKKAKKDGKWKYLSIIQDMRNNCAKQFEEQTIEFMTFCKIAPKW
ncbi:Uncharacterized protein BM_BM1099 [Brugia malayi]|uniref:Uncharacterized protein n=1 Tax=Brugia malayi TaxID=6279 RepID=A0A4E9FSW0_BRUMA|nr:Uncharacterized protein BM_BM1099 [Brugia malayi]VIO99747.1 Uncharacterized protein BM_BM1099 [Brugia malayi]